MEPCTLGTDDGDTCLAHAMVIVGSRRRPGPDQGLVLLVQTFWVHKQFFECDLDYLASRGATLTWVTAPDTIRVSAATARSADSLPGAAIARVLAVPDV